MARQKPQRSEKTTSKREVITQSGKKHPFHLEFLNQAQKMAWGAFDQHDVLFLLGPPGTGKSHLATAFAISEVLSKRKEKIVLTRPIIEAGESLGYLPGDMNEKVAPYMMPLFDCMGKMLGKEGPQREIINKSVDVAPLAYMRGRMIADSVYIPTPCGMKRHGDLKVGEYVFGSDGKPTKVIGVYPHGIKKIYKVKFSDYTEVRCGAEHLWNTMTLNEKRHNKGYTTKTTKEISETILNKRNQKIHRIPIVSDVVAFNERVIKIDPYLLGCLLGDGYLGKSIKLTTSDQEILEECSSRLPEDNEFVFRKKYDYSVKYNKNNLLKKELVRYNLIGKKSINKFVPDDYKFNTPEIRLEILQGLLDTDGWICKHRSGNCRIQYSSISKQLADDVMFLVRSLGGHAYSRLRKFSEKDNHEHNGRMINHNHSAYVVDIMMELCPFKLNRKAIQHINFPKPTKMIVDIVEDSEENATCIQVEAKDHLYLANDFIVTHNTFDDSVCIFDEAQNATKAQLKLFMTRFGKNSKIIITGDPNQSDLRSCDQGLMDTVGRLEDLSGVGVIYFKASSIVRHPIIAAILERLEEKDQD